MIAKIRVGFALLALTAAPLAAEDFHWQGAVARGKTVEIKGVNGSIDAVAGHGPEVEVTAVKHARHNGRAESVEIKVVEHAEGVTICALYPNQGSRPNECQPGEGGHLGAKNNDVEVRFEVKVPAGVRFVGRTVNGGIEATGMPADAEAHTVNGDVRLEAAGVAEGQTVNGQIRARMGRADWTGALRLNTVNGGITIELPEGTNASVRAGTVNGDISTDFPISVQGRFSKRHLDGTIGSGGRQLELETVNGSIELKKKL